MFYPYRIDADDRIVWVGDEWVRFARQNGTFELGRERVIGAPLLSFVADDETRALYRLLFDRVRRELVTVSVPFRCDGPSMRRFMRLYVSPAGGGELELEGRLLWQEPRPEVLLLDPSARRSDRELTICGWCKAVRVGEEWLSVETAIERLELFGSSRQPRQRQGVCADCDREVRQLIAG